MGGKDGVNKDVKREEKRRENKRKRADTPQKRKQ